MMADAPMCNCDTAAAENGSAFFPPGLLIRGRKSCLPVQCRGMDLLGIPFGRSIFVCVHQLSVELWKRYDTPRVSVQKKIQDLGIPIVNCSKEQIRELRRAGIIENFRATMVTLQDAERLYTALEYSRRKRGLVKHALKSAPTDRALRREEVRAKRLSLKLNHQLLSEGYQQQHLVHPLTGIVWPQRQGALNGEGDRSGEGGSTAVVGVQDEGCREQGLYSHIYPSDTPESFAKLLVADDVSELNAAETEFAEYELLIERVPNQSFVKPPSFAIPQRMEHSFTFPDSMQEPLDSLTGFQYARQVQGDSHTLDSSRLLDPAAAAVCLNLPVSRLSSPGVCSSSELEDQSSLLSNTSSRSLSATIRSTPERFLFLDSDSEIECDVSSNSNHNNCSVSQQRLAPQQTTGTLEETATFVGRGIQSSWVEKGENTIATVQSATSSHPQVYGSKHRKVAATKLRHFAQNTSPSSVHYFQPVPEDRPKSLIVSIPLALTRAVSPQAVTTAASATSKLRKPTALCNFATKKRALSRSPSVSSDTEITSPATVSTPNGSDMGAKAKTTNTAKGGKTGRPRGRPRLTATARSDANPETQSILKPSTSTNQTDSVGLQNGVAESVGKNSQAPTAVEVPAYKALVESSHVEDDQTSICSTTTTTSSTNSTVGKHKKLQRVLQRQAKSNSDILPTDSSFSIEALFSYYPPKLTVRDGELVPEQSLSLKNVDRSCLPSSHPIDSWRLGQPVRGRVVVTKTKRLKHPPKTHAQLAKV